MFRRSCQVHSVGSTNEPNVVPASEGTVCVCVLSAGNKPRLQTSAPHVTNFFSHDPTSSDSSHPFVSSSHLPSRRLDVSLPSATAGRRRRVHVELSAARSLGCTDEVSLLFCEIIEVRPVKY